MGSSNAGVRTVLRGLREGLMEKHRCCENVYDNFREGFHACGNSAKYERAGKWYCGIHDPKNVKARKEKHRIAWNEKQNKECERRHRIAAMEHFCEHLPVEFMETHEAIELINGY